MSSSNNLKLVLELAAKVTGRAGGAGAGSGPHF